MGDRLENSHADDLAFLQSALHDSIPLTRAIEITVSYYDSRELRLWAPLPPNINHKLTAFGGSIYSVAVLAGWGWVTLLLRQQGVKGHVVIHTSHMEYRKPVTDDFMACCQPPCTEAINQFLTMLKRKHKGRLELEIGVYSESEHAATLKGSYVVTLTHPNENSHRQAH